MTPAQIDALPDYSNAQMVKLLRYAIAELAGGGPDATVTVNSRTYTKKDLDGLKEMFRTFNELAAQDADASAIETTGCPVVTFQEPQV